MNHEELLSQLVEIKSYSGQEAQIRGFIKTWFENRDIEVIEQDENILVYLEGKDQTRAFIFNSHMDTVSAGNEKDWEHGPWNPTIIDDRLVGLGSSDMKSGLAATMLLAEQMTQQGRLPVDMWFTYVVKEEVDGSGSASFAEWFKKKGYIEKYQDIAGIFTEPTNLSEIEHGHRGNFFVQVTAKGSSGHSSRPHEVKGILAVRKMINFADILQQETDKWRKEFSDEYFDPSITVGEMTSIQAGVIAEKGENEQSSLKIVAESPNKFPSVCVAVFDIRTTPSFHPLAWEKLQDLAKEHGVEISMLYPAAPAGFTKPSEKIVRVARKILGESELTVSQASTDLGFLTAHGVKAVILGPGEKKQAHKVNEYCYPAQIPQAVEIYQNIVDAWAD